MANGTSEMVTHPSDGIYLSKFQAKLVSTLLATAIVVGSSNLWYLNRKSIEFQQHINSMSLPDAALPGSLPRREWALERQIIAGELRSINQKLDELKNGQERQDLQDRQDRQDRGS